MTAIQEKLSGYLSKIFGVEAMLHQLVEIEKIVNGKRRSVQQNRAMFGIAYKMIAEALTIEWGETVTIERVHEELKQLQQFKDILIEYQIVPYKPQEVKNKTTGEYELIYPRLSTAGLSTLGLMRYYEELQRFGATFLNISVPAPNEIDYTDNTK